MSKVDALRALREAKFNAVPAVGRPASAKVPGPAAAPKAAAVTASASKASSATAPSPKVAVKQVASVAEAGSDSCGHRSMNGRSCTRPSGHAEKNHRYG